MFNRKKHTKRKSRRNQDSREKNFLKIVIFLVIAGFLIIFAKVLLSNSFQYPGFTGNEKSPDTSPYNMEKLFQNKYNFRAYEDDDYYSLCGIDVSSHQGDINWNDVANSGADFAMIRVGYSGSHSGEIYGDKNYLANISKAREVGLKIGVYFFSQATDVNEAIEEAEFVLRQIDGKGVTLPVAFDMEPVEEGDRISTLSIEERTKIADAFCQRIAAGGYEPMIYGNYHWFTDMLDINKLSQYNLWLAHYSSNTTFPYAFTMWQYSDSGKVDGVSTNTDLNLLMIKK